MSKTFWPQIIQEIGSKLFELGEWKRKVCESGKGIE
jgi:hypothetical protein